MTKVKLVFNGSEISVWEFAALAYSELSGNVLFAEEVKKGKLMRLLEVLTDCESFVH